MYAHGKNSVAQLAPISRSIANSRLMLSSLGSSVRRVCSPILGLIEVNERGVGVGNSTTVGAGELTMYRVATVTAAASKTIMAGTTSLARRFFILNLTNEGGDKFMQPPPLLPTS